MGNKLYFDDVVDQAIIKFQTSEDRKEREELCKNHIMPAFTKLASYWYANLVFSRKNEEMIHDCSVYLYEKIPMFDAEKKTRGFAYFNMIARHWFFQKLKSDKKEASLEFLNLASYGFGDDDVAVDDALITDGFESSIEKKEFFLILKENLVKWSEKATKEQEKLILDALINLLENNENIIFKKKAILFYLREMTGMTPKQIASNLSKIKKKYSKLRNSYLDGDV